MGSNDADDFFHRTQEHNDILNEGTYLNKVEEDSQVWRKLLKSDIKAVFKELTDRAPSARIGYVPIIQRDYWNKPTGDFADSLDFYIYAQLCHEDGPKVKCLETRSLYNYIKKSDVPAHMNDDVITAFLQDDGLHLNNWGYEALLNDMAPPVMTYWSSIVHQWYA